MHELLGTAVKFRTHKGDVVDAIVVGFDHPEEGKPVRLHLVHASPEKLHMLGGTQWPQAFESAYSVPLLDENDDPYTCDLMPDSEMLASREIAISSLRNLLREAQEDVELLKQELAQSTEGKDKALQALADSTARQAKPDGTTVDPAVLPTAADLDAHAAEQKAKEATTGCANIEGGIMCGEPLSAHTPEAAKGDVGMDHDFVPGTFDATVPANDPMPQPPTATE